MDVKELPSGPIVLAVDMPGVSLSDVRVRVEEGNVLAICGKRERPSEDGGPIGETCRLLDYRYVSDCAPEADRSRLQDLQIFLINATFTIFDRAHLFIALPSVPCHFSSGRLSSLPAWVCLIRGVVDQWSRSRLLGLLLLLFRGFDCFLAAVSYFDGVCVVQPMWTACGAGAVRFLVAAVIASGGHGQSGFFRFRQEKKWPEHG